MSEERLKDLLARSVPEAPEIRPDDVPARAAVVRRRRVAAAGAMVAVTVVAAVGGGLALRGGDPTTVSPADDVPTTPTGSTAPYDVPVCPARLPDIDEARTSAELAGVVAIRACPDLVGSLGGKKVPPDPADVALLADHDALVLGLDGFREAVAGTSEGIPNFCATVDFFHTRASLMLVHADGSTDLLWTPPCNTVTVDGRQVEGSAVRLAFAKALDRQRDDLDYTRPFRGIPCESGAGEGGPAAPGREQLVSAAYCGGEGDPVQLDDDQLALLRAAWHDPQPVEERLDEHGENDCTEGGDGTAIYAGTDRSDVVRLSWSPCGFLFWNSWEPGDGAAIPITLEGLGLR